MRKMFQCSTIFCPMCSLMFLFFLSGEVGGSEDSDLLEITGSDDGSDNDNEELEIVGSQQKLVQH